VERILPQDGCLFDKLLIVEVGLLGHCPYLIISRFFLYFAKFFLVDKMPGKGSMVIESFEIVEDKQILTQKPTWNHVEEAPAGEKTTREPYWDPPYVIGASRNLSSDGSPSSHHEKVLRPGFWKRRWRLFRRHWILYAIAGVIFLAVFLPVL
jgi:hypothetical protein